MNAAIKHIQQGETMTTKELTTAERKALVEKRRAARLAAEEQRRELSAPRIALAKAGLDPDRPSATDRQELARKRLDRASSRFLEGPVDEVYYPSAGMKLSRFGEDKGPVKRDTRQDPEEVGGQVAIVSRVRDGLDKMRESGHISPHELDAAREFQQAFRACGYDRVKTTNLTGTSGGGSSLEDHIVRTTEARNQVHAVMDMLGGPDSPMWKAAFWIVGHGISLHESAKNESADRKVWAGFIRAGLYLMGQDYQKRLKAKTAHRSSGRSNRNV